MSSPRGIEPFGGSDRIVFNSTSLAGEAVPLLFIDVEPDVVPAGLLPSVSGEDVEAMCAERAFSCWTVGLCIVVERR